ncbi:MAG TPA: GNAT family N-acetyltransferase [Rubellimicrobium sp.]|nr:GNAT family N-acetyltransferase [Rubellimicrobium sp.]
MVDLPAPYRHATPADAPALAHLVDIAGEGLPSYLWAQMAEEGETALDVGRWRARREEGSFSYRNAVVADPGGGVEAALVGYPLPDGPESIPDDLPAMFVPLQKLENLAGGTWYVNVLATYPEYRDQGHGTHLLGIAQRLARAAGCRGLSLIVADTNFGARRLYERSGFRPMASRRMVKEGWQGPGENFLLMIQEGTA